MSSFKSIDLFGSGPHRTAVGPRGQLSWPNTRFDIYDPGTVPLGLVELDITITGRLVGATESALRTLRDAVAAEVLHPPTAGTLVDTTGRSWTGMSFVEYREEPVVDRGRAWSVGYTAVFRKYLAAP